MLGECQEPDDPFDHPSAYENNASGTRLMWDTHIVRTILLFHRGRYKQAVKEHKRFLKTNAHKQETVYKVHFYNFLVSLHSLAYNKRLKGVKKQYKAFGKYAACGSPHGRGLWALLQAERQTNLNSAVVEYKQAIDWLHQAQLGLWEAVAYERLSRVLHAVGMLGAARKSMQRAYQMYESFHVKIKTDSLKREYGGELSSSH